MRRKGAGGVDQEAQERDERHGLRHDPWGTRAQEHQQEHEGLVPVLPVPVGAVVEAGPDDAKHDGAEQRVVRGCHRDARDDCGRLLGVRGGGRRSGDEGAEGRDDGRGARLRRRRGERCNARGRVGDAVEGFDCRERAAGDAPVSAEGVGSEVEEGVELQAGGRGGGVSLRPCVPLKRTTVPRHAGHAPA